MDEDRREGGDRRLGPSMARTWQIANLDDQALKLLIALTEEHLRNWGSAPTPDQLRAELRSRTG